MDTEFIDMPQEWFLPNGDYNSDVLHITSADDMSEGIAQSVIPPARSQDTSDIVLNRGN